MGFSLIASKKQSDPLEKDGSASHQGAFGLGLGYDYEGAEEVAGDWIYQFLDYTDKALEAGKVGDSRIVVPCVPFVFDEAAKYPGLNSDSQIIIGENVTINYEGEYIHKDKKAALIVMGEDNTSKTIFSDSTEFNAEGQSRIVFK